MPTEIRRPAPPPRGAAPADVEHRVPRGVLIGAAALIVVTIGTAAIARRTGAYHVTLPPTHAVASRDLLFADRSDGGVVVTEAGTGKLVSVVPPETGGFLRGIMRGLVREHRLKDQPAGAPFRLTRWADGRLSIADPSTQESFNLGAFGPTNEAAFASLLDEGAPRR